FAEDAEHLEQSLAGRRAGVVALLVQIEVDLFGMHLAEERDQVLQRSTEPVDRPGRNDIELAARHALGEAIEAGALSAPLRSADAAVDELGDNAPPMPDGSLLEREALVVDGLTVRAHAEVKSNCPHLNLELCVRDMASSSTFFNCFSYI